MIVYIKSHNLDTEKLKKSQRKVLRKEWIKAYYPVLLCAILLSFVFLFLLHINTSVKGSVFSSIFIIFGCFVFGGFLSAFNISLNSKNKYLTAKSTFEQFDLLSKAIDDRKVKRVMFKNGGYEIVLLAKQSEHRLQQIVLDYYGLVQTDDNEYKDNVIEVDYTTQEVIYHYENNIPCNVWLECEVY